MITLSIILRHKITSRMDINSINQSKTLRSNNMSGRCKQVVCCFFTFICFFIILSLPSWAATVTGTVTYVGLEHIFLDIGSAKGVRAGDPGRVYYEVEVGLRKKHIPVYVARFTVIHISQNSSMARIKGEATGEIREGYLVEITVEEKKEAVLPKTEETKEPQPGEIWKDPKLGMEFVWVLGGCYQMGSGMWTGNCYDDEIPMHIVCVDGFWIGKYEVTQGQWQSLMGDNPSRFKNCGKNCPVERVSWNEAVEFARRLSQKTGYKFRLPTEAEWEYACRSGGREEKYSGSDNVDAVAWYLDNSSGHTHPVGSKRSNGLGIHDMSGNVWEWCQDWYNKYYYGISPWDNPQGPSSGSVRVLRGGSWHINAGRVRCAYRNRSGPGGRGDYVGFRLVRIIDRQ
jgi:formylglycine-generating enzyme required for sulfatase activity